MPSNIIRDPIACRYLQKFGFTGRLGLREDGIARPVEAETHEGTQGLGFNAKSKSKQIAAKKEHDDKQRSFIGDTRDTRDSKGKRGQAKKDNSWKKGNVEMQTTAVKIDVDELIRTQMMSAEAYVKEEGGRTKIIDMRASEAVEVGSMSEIGTVGNNGMETPSEEDREKPKIGQELLYNLSLEQDRLERDIDTSTYRRDIDVRLDPILWLLYSTQ